MGDPRAWRKKYKNPKKPWDRKVLETESKLLETYGLRNKRELRRIDGFLHKKRSNAKRVLALPLEQRLVKEKELLNSLIRIGVMRGTPALSDVLSLDVESFLERRLQTIVWRKNLSNTVRQARQFISHGHIAINGKKVNIPSYVVRKEEEENITYFGTPMVLHGPEQEAKDSSQLANDFAEMRGEPEGTEQPLRGEVEEPPISPDAADAQRITPVPVGEGK